MGYHNFQNTDKIIYVPIPEEKEMAYFMKYEKFNNVDRSQSIAWRERFDMGGWS